MDEITIKERQSYVSSEGRKYEEWLIEELKKDEVIAQNFLVGKPSEVLDENNREKIKISYGEKKEEIDADVCIVRKKDNKLVIVISVKKSFRERGAQTAYWALKVKQNRKDYLYILVTPDVDKELYDENNPTKKNKWRIILPYECDAVFICTEGKKCKDKNFYVGTEYLVEFIRNLKD